MMTGNTDSVVFMHDGKTIKAEPKCGMCEYFRFELTPDLAQRISGFCSATGNVVKNVDICIHFNPCWAAMVYAECDRGELSCPDP